MIEFTLNIFTFISIKFRRKTEEFSQSYIYLIEKNELNA
jgi:hypothetical protein